MDKIHHFQNREEIMDEACDWVLVFNGDTPASQADIDAMRQWAARSPAHKQALREAEDFWCEAELLAELAVPAQKTLRGRALSTIGKLFGWLPGITAQPGWWTGPRTAIASLVFVSLGAVLLWQFSGLNQMVGNGVYSTAIGEQTTLLLRDRSQIQLDTDSQVRIAYSEGTRTIHLLRGKAHFDVAKNPQRPFQVIANEGLVRAVGTAFSVYLANRGVEVIVNEGRVNLARLVADKPAAADLTPAENPAVPNAGKVFLTLDRGQGAQFDSAQQVLVQLSDKQLDNELAWREGTLVFVRDPLSEVVYEVSRYTNTTIEIVDPQLGDLVMGGRFEVGKLDALLEVLEIGFGVKVVYINKNHVQLSLASNE